MTITSVGTPAGRRSSSYYTAAFDAMILSCGLYQKMIDRGWRRAGTWCYKPDLRASCCPQYTIRLDAVAFKASKSQRKLVNRWNRYVVSGKQGEAVDIVQAKETAPTHIKSSKATAALSLSASIHAAEHGEQESATHNFQTTLEPASFTDEKYALFAKYQETIHHDYTSSPSGFTSFLVSSPLEVAPIPYEKPPPGHLPTNYGSYHQLYRLDGQLIAVGVLDILPSCVSSVYFMYDKTWEEFSLGKLSALREVSLAREMHDAGAPQMEFLYMGFYIHSCPKMRYKGEYSPSYLADPETYTWFPLSTCMPLLDKYRYACFQNPDNSMNDFSGQTELEDDNTVPLNQSDISDIQLVEVINGEIHFLPMRLLPDRGHLKEIRGNVLACVQGLGVDASKEVGFYCDIW